MISIEKYWQRVSNNLRMCLCCHHKAEAARLFCSICRRDMQIAARRNWVRFDKGVPHLSLYNWRDGEHQIFQRFAQTLKGGGVPNIFASLAAEMTTLRFGLYPRLNANAKIHFVPAAGSSKYFRDHAEELAAQLAHLWQAEYSPFLLRTTRSKQKKKRLELRRARFEVKPEIRGEMDSNDTYIFVDDVLTTGSTAQAAFRALGKPRNFEIWTLFYRPRLRGQRS